MTHALNDAEAWFLGILSALDNDDAHEAGIVPVSKVASDMGCTMDAATKVAERLHTKEMLFHFKADGAVQIKPAGETEVEKTLHLGAMRNVKMLPLNPCLPPAVVRREIESRIAVGEQVAQANLMEGGVDEYLGHASEWVDSTSDLLHRLFQDSWVRYGFVTMVRSFPPTSAAMIGKMTAYKKGAGAAVEWLRMLLNRPELQPAEVTTPRAAAARGRRRLDYDAFICHADEDKDRMARPLANALTALKFRIWYDEFELTVGDSLRRSIDKGLAASRYGIVILSHAFFAKNWPKYELDGLVTREMEGYKVILPIWHGVTEEDVKQFSSPLAGRVALITEGKSVEEIAKDLAAVLSAHKRTASRNP